jgi:hypothetical protein
VSAPVWNLQHDFNDPLEHGVVLEDPRLPVREGDFVRLVDLDPTAGHMLCRVTGVRPSRFHDEVRILDVRTAGALAYWSPMEQPES